jgi:glycosyltransferase involved in cell wall biosynthesis
MRVRAIHQFLPSFAARDAIGSHTLQVQRALRDLGYESEIYAEHRQPDTRKIAHYFRDLGHHVRPDTVLLYHASTGSKVAEFVRQRAEPLAIDYHNVTPAKFFEGWEPIVAAELRSGRRDLKRLARRTTLGLADSAYNASELDDLGYKHTFVVPILLDTTDFERAVDDAKLAQLQDDKNSGGVDLLFVGRVSPNKCQHDLVKVLAAYRRAYDPNARLRIVGGSSSHAYETTIRKYADALGLADAVDLAGSVTSGELAAYYRTADVFVSVSEHEGFCVPVVEAMAHDVPVVAYAAAAVPETVGDGGVLVDEKTAPVMAAAVARVAGDPVLRAQLVEAGRARLQRLSLGEARRRLGEAVHVLTELLA